MTATIATSAFWDRALLDLGGKILSRRNYHVILLRRG